MYKNNNTKIRIICKKHGEFAQCPKSHLKGANCPSCHYESRRKTTEQFIKKAKETHGDKYDYSLVDYQGNKVKVKIKCKIHNFVFLQAPSNHLINNCPKCSLQKRKISQEEFIKKAKETHGNTYDYSLAKYMNTETKIKIICKKHGIFSQRPSDHLSGNGCNTCFIERKRHTKESFIEKAKEIHGDKYNYNLVEYKHSKNKVKIICKKHGTFNQKPNDHLSGYGCRYCSVFINTEKFIERAKKVHGNKFNYKETEFKNSHVKVKIICEKHGVFKQRPYNHLNGMGCRKCLQYDKEDFVKKAKEIHGNKYNYKLVDYKNVKTKVEIICKEHGSFFQVAAGHLFGRGCSNCCSNSVSKKETEWLNYLKINKKHRNNTIKINKRNFMPDAYVPETNTIYEFYGDYWHGNIKRFKQNDTNKNNKKTFGELYQKTLEKEKIYKQAGYNVISIWESDWDKLSKTIRKNNKKKAA